MKTAQNRRTPFVDFAYWCKTHCGSCGVKRSRPAADDEWSCAKCENSWAEHLKATGRKVVTDSNGVSTFVPLI